MAFEGGKVPRANIYREPKSTIVTGDTPEDVQRKALELQQEYYSNNLYWRTSSEYHNQAMLAETTRYSAFVDYDGMDYYPIIGSALNMYADEVTTIGEDGNLINVYAKSPRVKAIIEDLLYNVLDINTNLFPWTRTTIKYGDSFLFINSSIKKGITGVRPLMPLYIKREEEIIPMKGDSLKFINTQNLDEYNPYQIAHFRLMGDDKFLPYGCSILSKVRRTWMQLVRAEDSMMVYRLNRGTERRVFKVYVGNMDTADVDAYIKMMMSKFKKTPQVNRNNGFVEFKYDTMPVDEDFFIPIREQNDPSGIETLAAGANLDTIGDIEYLRNNLFTGLEIPKSILAYEEPVGDGKSFALVLQQFSRKVNRIQQTMLMELNKLVIIHLYMLGLYDDLYDFKLTMNNPSIQNKMALLEVFDKQYDVYEKFTKADENGWAAMSITNAKKKFFNMSEKEIAQDLNQQAFERVIKEELVKKGTEYKKTGIFDEVDTKLKSINKDTQGEATPSDDSGTEDTSAEPEETEGDETLAENQIFRLLSEHKKMIDDMKKNKREVL